MTTINEDFMKAVGKRIKELRENQNLTQVKLSNELLYRYNINIGDRSISRYETGQGLPETDNLIYLADFFNTTTDYILYGKELSDDNSFTWYDTFKRLNRLVYPLAVGLGKGSADGRIYLELWDDEMKVYYDKLQSDAATKNYMFNHYNKDFAITVKDLDNLFLDFQKNKKQLKPNEDRFNRYFKSHGIDPEQYKKQRIADVSEKREL